MPIAAILNGETGDHAGVRGTGHGADDDVVEEHVVLRFLRRHLARPVGEPEPAERMVGGASRDRVRLAAGLDHRVDRLLPRVAETDVEAGRIDPHVAAHDPAELDVADLVVSPCPASRPSPPAP